MLTIPHFLVAALFLSSGLACIPTVTPDDMYEDEMGTTTSVLMTMMSQEMTSTSNGPITSTSTAARSSTTSTTSTTTTTTTTTTTILYMCPSAMWILNSMTGRCYQVQSTPASWTGSENACITLGAHLVSFSDQAENDFVHDVVILPTSPAFNSVYWIGLMQPMNTNGLSTMTTWSDGTSYDYASWSNWKTIPPGMSGARSCIFMYANAVPAANSGTWDVAGLCGGNYPYVC